MAPEFDEYELTQELVDTAAGITSLGDFVGWFLPRSWNFNDLGSSSLSRMVGAVKLKIYEYQGDFWNVDLRAEFRKIAEGVYDD